MKKIIITLTAFVMTAVLSFSQQVTILHTSDSHSHLTESGVKDINGYPKQGTISRVAYTVGAVRYNQPNALFFHSGDYSTGDLIYNSGGVPELKILKGAGCDAMAVGNHEFDQGPDVLYGALSEVFSDGGFPLLSANCDMTAFPELSSFIAPYTVKTVNGVKIGIFGLTIPDPTIKSYPVIITSDIDLKAYETVSYLKETRECDVVILLSHLGFNLDYMIASGIPGIDFIFGGHDHRIVNTSVQNPGGTLTRIYHSGEYYMNLSKVSFTFYGGLVTNVNYHLINIDNTIPSVPEIDSVVNGLKGNIGLENYVPGPLALTQLEKNVIPTSHFKDTPLGNLVTDSYRGLTGAQIGFTVQGLMSESIYRGGVSANDAFRAVGYGFKLVTFKLYGAELLGALEYAIGNAALYQDYYPQVSGLSFKFNMNMPNGKKIIPGSVKINGKLLKADGDYSLTTNEGLYGILASMGLPGREKQTLDTYEVEALMGFLFAKGSISYTSEGRINDATNIP